MRICQRMIRVGPIPARAGEPHSTDLSDFHGRAYPRSRGGTLIDKPYIKDVLGLSPLARGNRGPTCL